MSDGGLVRNAGEGVNPKTAGWTYLSFRTVGCRADEILAGETGADETALIWLGGRAEVDGFGQVGGRDDVFSGLPSALLLPPGASYWKTNTVTLPLAQSGSFFLILQANSGNSLFEADFDLPGAARFVLGPNARSLTPEQNQEFVALFKEYLAQAYSTRLGEYGGAPFHVTGSRPSDRYFRDAGKLADMILAGGFEELADVPRAEILMKY